MRGRRSRRGYEAPSTPFEMPQMTPAAETVDHPPHVRAGVVDHDPVNAPRHYRSHPSGVECIDVVEHMGFNLGNAIKYIWRADEKGRAVEDLRKARWYIDRELARREDAP